MLNFDSQTGFSVSETSDIRDGVAKDWVTAFKEQGRPDLDTDPETPQGQVIDSQTAAIHQKDVELAFLAQQFNPQTASGRWQDALAKIYFISRKPAINSTCVCTLTGINGTTVTAGALIRSNYDQTLWSLNKDATIGSDGTTTATFTCQSEGAIQAGVATLTQIVTAIPGWDAVTNATAAEVGQLVESQAAFEARRYQSVALNGRSITTAVYARVAEVDSVIAAYVTDNKTNVNKTIDGYTLSPHSIYVAAIGGADEDIAKAIYNSVSAGCDYNGNTTVNVTDPNTGAIEAVTFMRPTQLSLYVKVTLQDDGNLPDGYKAIVQQAVYNNFYGLDTTTTISGEAILRVVMNSDLYASRFMPSVLNAGIRQILRVEVSADNSTWVDYVHVPISNEPTLELENIQVVVAS